MPSWGTRTSSTATLLVFADRAENDNDSNAHMPIANASIFMSATIMAGHSQCGSAEAAFNVGIRVRRYTRSSGETTPRADGRARGGQRTRRDGSLSDRMRIEGGATLEPARW